MEAVDDAPDTLTWDTGAILSIIGLNYPLGDRTLFREITRQPWLSETHSERSLECQDIPPHGHRWLAPDQAADLLRSLLLEELTSLPLKNRSLHLLLSGGLDSRIIAGIVALAREQGRLASDIQTHTWGLPESRDVNYAREIAGDLGFAWHHLDLGPTHLRENIRHAAVIIGALASPTHLHRMAWFEDAPEDALVIAGSYGDSVGRAEYSGLHVLDIPTLRPVNTLDLLSPSYLNQALSLVTEDQSQLAARAPGIPAYMTREHERQGHYMRNMISMAMSVIDHSRPLYQMFTAPSVYQAMWQLHPCARTNQVYELLLEGLGHGLANVPWARTNRTLRGRARGGHDLEPSYHHYSRWASQELFRDLSDLVDPKWFARQDVFSGPAVANLLESVRRDPHAQGKHGRQPHERLLWLASVRTLAEELKQRGKSIISAEPSKDAHPAESHRSQAWLLDLRRSLLNRGFTRPLQSWLIRRRHTLMRKRALRRFPPQPWSDD